MPDSSLSSLLPATAFSDYLDQVPTSCRFASRQLSWRCWVLLEYRKAHVSLPLASSSVRVYRLLLSSLYTLESPLRHSEGIGRMLTTENLPMIGIEDTRTHLLRRRAWNRAFSSNAVSQYEELVGVRARQLVQRLEEHRGQEISLQKWMDYFS